MVVNGLRLTLTLPPGDPFAGQASVAGQQALRDLEDRLGSDVPATREEASLDLDALLFGEPPLVPVAEARANELQQENGLPEIYARLRTSARKVRDALTGVTYAFNAQNGMLTVTLDAATNTGQPYARALIVVKVIDADPTPVKTDDNSHVIDNPGGSTDIKLTLIKSGTARLSLNIVYQDADAHYLSDITRTLNLQVNEVQ